MSGYPHNYGGHGAPPSYGAPPPSSAQTYGAPPPSTTQPYGSSSPYGATPPSSAQNYGATPSSTAQSYGYSPYGAPPPSSAHSYGGPPPPTTQSYGSSSPYAAPSSYGAVNTPYSSYSSEPTKPPKENKPSAPYGAPASSAAYGAPASSAPYGAPASSAPYGAPASSAPYGVAAPSAPYGGGVGASPFAALVPSVFPPGTDPNIVACFQVADQDGSGFIDDKEMQRALSSYNQSFSLRTVHLLMYLFTNTNARKIGPKEFTELFYSLQNWRGIFERFDRDRSGKIDVTELRDSLLSLGFSVSPTVLELLVSKFDKSGGKAKAVEYDNFIECCLTVKGLTEKFKEKDIGYTGSATFTYESFMLTVLPFLIA